MTASKAPATANPLNPEVWLRILSYLSYYDLKRIRGVNESFSDSCQIRSIQEALFCATLNKDATERKFKLGDQVQFHPILSQISYHLHERPAYETEVYGKDTEKDEKITSKFLVKGWNEMALQKVMDENATSPPVQSVKFLGQYRDVWQIRKLECDNFDSDSELGSDDGADSESELDVEIENIKDKSRVSSFKEI